MKRVLKFVVRAIGMLLVFLILAFGFLYYYSVNYDMYDLGLDKEDFAELKSEADIPVLAERLVSEMSLEEKIDQMYGEGYSSAPKMGINFLLRGRFPHVYSGGNERLNIPPWVLSDGPRGARVMDQDVFGVTTFPVAMARGASWDTDLERRIHEVIAIEMRANKTNYAATPCINLLRHPAWGRAQETYGEDTYLLGEFGVAAVRGIEKHKVMACPKHFALNSLDNSRLFVDVEVDERTLREVYLPHFKKVVQEGKPASIMSAYNKVNGAYSANNKYLLNDILRQEWGFEGFVTSDWVYGTRDGIGSIKAGLNVEMPFQNHYSDENVRAGLESGEITEEDIDRLVLESLSTRLKYAMADDSMEYGKDLIASKVHTDLAREAAEKSMVLVKNENVLPFEKDGPEKKILVLGRLADLENTGDRASSDATPAYVVTPYQGIVNYHKETGNPVELYSGEDLDMAREKASKADQVILVVGYTFEDEGEYLITEGAMKKSAEAGKLIGDRGIGGDRNSLKLVNEDENLIEAVAGTNNNTVVIYVGGSAIDMSSWEDEVPAILFAWYNGMEGGNALARIVYGEVNPSGKLPFSIAKNSGDYPYFNPYAMKIEYDYYHGYTLFDKKEIDVAYSFGHGLSYTTFEYDSLKVDPLDAENKTLKVRARVTNTGKTPGEEVVQLYVGFANSEIDRPVKLLKGFDKFLIQPGESRTAEFDLDLEELTWYDPESKTWKLEKMEYEIFVGPSSDKDKLLKGSFTLE